MRGRFAGDPSISNEFRQRLRLSYRTPSGRGLGGGGQVQPSRRNIRTPSIRTNSNVTPHLEQTVSSFKESFPASWGVSQPGQFSNSSRDGVRGVSSKELLNEQPRSQYCKRDRVRSESRAQHRCVLGSHHDKNESSRNCCRPGCPALNGCS